MNERNKLYGLITNNKFKQNDIAQPIFHHFITAAKFKTKDLILNVYSMRFLFFSLVFIKTLQPRTFAIISLSPIFSLDC